jgi:hypothetical protein
MLWLRQYITTANHTMSHASPMDYNEKKPLAAEVEQIKGMADAGGRREAAERLSKLLNVLKMTRDEALPRMDRIEARLTELEPKASPKSKAAFALMRRAMGDSRRIYQQAVPSDEILNRALADTEALKVAQASPDAQPGGQSQ